jgi:hypothetical protein
VFKKKIFRCVLQTIFLKCIEQFKKEKEGKKDRKTERQKDRKTERQKDRKTERQKDRKTERQKDRKTEKHKSRLHVCASFLAI